MMAHSASLRTHRATVPPVLALILRPLRRRRALKALAAYSEAKDAYRRAVVAGDTRRQHETLPALNAAMIARLRAEIALGIEA